MSNKIFREDDPPFDTEDVFVMAACILIAVASFIILVVWS